MLTASYRAVDESMSASAQPFHPFGAQELLVPGTAYELQIEMQPSFHTLVAGSRLELSLSSDDLQHNSFQRNIDVQLLLWPVTNTVHTGSATPSRLLTVVEGDGRRP